MSDDTLRPKLIATSIITTVMSTLALTLRLWSKLISRIPLTADDWTFLAAYPCTVAQAILLLHATLHLGFGLHFNDALASGSTPASFNRVIILSGFFYNTAVSLVKISVLLFFARIFRNVSGIAKYRVALWSTGALVIAWWVTWTVQAVAPCEHKSSELVLQCAEYGRGLLGDAGSNVVLDVVILVLPIPMLWGLQMSWKRKTALIGEFAVCYSVVAISIARLVYFVRFVNGDGGSTDPSWDFVNPAIFTTLEPPIAILCVSLPSISLFWRRAHTHGMRALGSRQTFPSDYSATMGKGNTRLGSPAMTPPLQHNSQTRGTHRWSPEMIQRPERAARKSSSSTEQNQRHHGHGHGRRHSSKTQQQQQQHQRTHGHTRQPTPQQHPTASHTVSQTAPQQQQQQQWHIAELEDIEAARHETLRYLQSPRSQGSIAELPAIQTHGLFSGRHVVDADSTSPQHNHNHSHGNSHLDLEVPRIYHARSSSNYSSTNGTYSTGAPTIAELDDPESRACALPSSSLSPVSPVTPFWSEKEEERDSTIPRPIPTPPVPLRHPERPVANLDDIVSPISPGGGIREFHFGCEVAPSTSALGEDFVIPRRPVHARAPWNYGKNKPLPKLPSL